MATSTNEKENKLMANTPHRAATDHVNLTGITIEHENHNLNDTTTKSSPSSSRSCFRKLPYAIFSDIFIGIIVVVLVAVIELGIIQTAPKGYYCKDPTISRPYGGDTISITLLFIVTFFAPLLVILGVELSQGRFTHKSFCTEYLRWYRDLTIGAIFLLLATEVIKIIIGEPRPHFMNTCQPDSESNCTPGTYVTKYKCTNTFYSNYIILDSARSFPSGHSALSFFVSVYCTGFVHHRFRGRNCGRLMKPLIMSICLLWGIICSISRIADNRHHWWDVLSGVVLGIIYGLYFIVYVTVNFQSKYNNGVTSSTKTLLNVKTNRKTSAVI